MQKKLFARYKSTIFPKILLVFMLVITPLCMMSLFINAKGESAVKQEIDKSLGSKTSYFVDTLETEANRMYEHQQGFNLDKDLQRLVYVDNTLDRFEWGQTINRLQEKMEIIKTSSKFINSVSVQMLTIGKAISNEDPYNAIDQEAVDAFMAQYKDKGTSIINVKGRLLLGYVNPVAILAQKKPDYIIFIELSIPELRNAMMQFANYEHSGAILADVNRKWNVSTDSDKDVLAAMSRFADERDEKNESAKIESFKVGSTSYLVSYRYSQFMNMKLLVFVPEKSVLGDLDSYRIWFWVLAIVSMLIVVVFSTWIYRLIHKPLNKLVFSFRKVEDGYLEPTVLPTGQDEFRYLFEGFNSMVVKLKELIHELYEQEIRVKSSELKQLQSQINPHFLYNTYFILHRLAKMDDIENVILFSQYLGEYFQFITRNGASEIPLEEEVKHGRLYVEIQQIRFSNRIDVEFDDLPESCKHVMVPKLILQPILENAYKYGMERKKDDGLIKVTIKHDEVIRITVEDNGAGMTDEAMHKLQSQLGLHIEGDEITGINNVHRRLQLQFGKESGIRLYHGSDGGLKVVITITVRDKFAQAEAIGENNA
ncbi:sensor histidine kinase [Paenibacillus rhizovicinus]|uniref:Sensor histidine kinase n=1 Tax=Paenibacillus rhizovicinus TaxID=2704463 RepID=A0A6C0P8M3_9BACL|nr:sensor histidine kinase [Paenibacillus rhizovicinus]QHW32882.1 sensor histidine kinase [Paenibacillus rhizovicinus]